MYLTTWIKLHYNAPLNVLLKKAVKIFYKKIVYILQDIRGKKTRQVNFSLKTYNKFQS